MAKIPNCSAPTGICGECTNIPTCDWACELRFDGCPASDVCPGLSKCKKEGGGTPIIIRNE